MKLQTKDLKGIALDWAVARCERWVGDKIDMPNYCTDWARGGPIIEREEIAVKPAAPAAGWEACNCEYDQQGNTPLEAAMRCYVGITLGEEVEVPDEFSALSPT